METTHDREDYTENQNRHDFGPSEPYGKDSDFDAENAKHLPDDDASDEAEPVGPLDAVIGQDADDSLTNDLPHDADPN